MGWLESGGGPLICLSRTAASHWRGIEGWNPEAVLGTDGSDYGRACKVAGYLGVIQVGNDLALILGDMPMTTAVTRLPNGNTLIVRLMTCEEMLPPREFAERAALSGLGAPEEISDVEFHNGDLVVFDSAATLEDAGDIVEFHLPAGRYRVTTHSVDLDGTAQLVVHEFTCAV